MDCVLVAILATSPLESQRQTGGHLGLQYAAVTIWVDADACPGAIREILLRASARRSLPLCFVANRAVPSGGSPLVTSVRVGGRFDAADAHIAEHVAAGDLVITADVPLAARIVAAGALGISPRGEVFNADNVGEKLAARDLMTGLREAGMVGGGPPPLGPNDRKRFADALDRALARFAR